MDSDMFSVEGLMSDKTCRLVFDSRWKESKQMDCHSARSLKQVVFGEACA